MASKVVATTAQAIKAPAKSKHDKKKISVATKVVEDFLQDETIKQSRAMLITKAEAYIKKKKKTKYRAEIIYLLQNRWLQG